MVIGDSVFKFQMNDLRLLLQADKDRKIIDLEFKQINNLQLMMPILAKFQNLESLSLNGNRLQSLPFDLTCLEKLIELDISNNLFKDISEIMPALQTLPRLTHLMYSLKNDEEESLIKKTLPKLERLNKKPLNTVALVSKKQKELKNVMRLNENDLEDIAVIYDDIRQVYKRNKYFVDKQLADEFDKGVDNIMGELSGKLGASGVEEEVNSSIVSCKYALVDLCFVKLITYFYHFDRNIASILERIHDNIAESFRYMNDILKNSMDRSKAEIAQVALKKEELYKSEIRRLKQIQESHLSEIGNLETKNAELLDKMTKHSKTNILETTIGNIIKRRGKSPAKQGGPLRTRENVPQTLDNTEMAIKFNKTLTLNQLKEVVNELHASKNKHNAICLDTGVAMETLETHMYTFLNQKYGLKPITVEWAMSIVNGIKKYGHDDAEVAAFGKMLRNELEEEFVETMRKTKGQVRASIRKFKGDQNPTSLSVHECEEILLVSGYKRDTIDTMTSRISQDQLSNGLLTPSQLEQLVVEHTLRKHCERIKALTVLFRHVDTDESGMVNHQQLYLLVEKLNIKAEIDADELIEMLDPFHTNSITFSHLVQQFQRINAFKEVFLT